MSGLTVLTLQTSLMGFIKSEAPDGWTAVVGQQNAPAPNTKQLELRRGTPFIIKVGRDVRSGVDGTGKVSTEGTRELLFQLRGYSVGAIQILEDIRSRLDDEDVIDYMVAAALAVIEVGPIQNLTSLYGAQFKEVGCFDLRLRTHSLREGSDAADVGFINDVVLEVTSRAPGPVDTVKTIEVIGP